jgi:hypothetical protein
MLSIVWLNILVPWTQILKNHKGLFNQLVMHTVVGHGTMYFPITSSNIGRNLNANELRNSVTLQRFSLKLIAPRFHMLALLRSYVSMTSQVYAGLKLL